MATSGTTTFNPDQSDIIEDAASMAGTELRTGYDMRMARFAINMLMQEWGNRGYNLWTVTSSSIPLVQGTAAYTLPTDIIDVIEATVRTGDGNVSLQADITIRRIGVAQYSSTPNKLQQGRPVQYFVQRLIAPTITVWPVPDLSSTYVLYYYYLRRMQDAGGTADLTMDLPARFMPALVTGLAYHIAVRKPELQARVQGLKMAYEEQWELAAGEDRERSSTRWVPRKSHV